MVLDEGRLHEFDTPENLLSTPDSLFAQLVLNAATVTEGTALETVPEEVNDV